MVVSHRCTPVGRSAVLLVIHKLQSHTALLLLSLWLNMPPVMGYSTACGLLLAGAVAAIIMCVPAASASEEHIARININALQLSDSDDMNMHGRWHALCFMCK